MNLKLPDFDTLKRLHEDDPSALEALRQKYIAMTIDQATPDTRRRLRGLQFQIDACVQIKPNGLSRCIAVTQMMRRSFQELIDTLNIASKMHQQVSNTLETIAPSNKPSAQIIPFPGSSKRNPSP